MPWCSRIRRCWGSIVFLKSNWRSRLPTGALGGEIDGPDLALLRRLINRHTQRLDRYACRSCGFQARRYYWQCPGCNAWETYKPRRLEELE